ncbi:MAG: hypothetical protein II502_05745 [Paludibacteraceae bacterium]|nr:hypothetical protein [Paludibacteraceae bacterium]
MKKIYFLIATALLAVTFTSCQKDEETNEQDLYGKWQNQANTGWYRVFYNDIVTDDPTYKWGKEWDENDPAGPVYEKDLTEHGNGWFKWKKTKNNLLELHQMDNDGAEIPQENTITVLTATEFFYKDQAGRSYQFIKVK